MNYPKNKKIKPLEEIVSIAEALKLSQKIIVTTNGSYDIFHAGHAWSLQESKGYGDILIVGINSDSSIKKYKSKHRPIIKEALRAEVVASLECVDFVFIFNDTTPNHFLEKIKPHIHTNSNDYGEKCVEADTLTSINAELKLLKKYNGISSTTMIKHIQSCPRTS